MRRFLLLVTLVAALILAVSPAGAQGAVIVGTAGDDNLSGTSGDDMLIGLGGSDRLRGFGGNDTLEGDEGNDTLLGGSGDDSLDGGTGTDLAGFYTTMNDSAICGVTVNLTALSASGGGAGTDVFVASGGLSTVEQVEGSLCNDRLVGDGQNNYLRGNAGNDFIFGERRAPKPSQTPAGNDTLVGDSGDDFLTGEGGDDKIQPGAGADTAFGGFNTALGDTLKYNDASAAVIVDIGANTTGGGAAGDTIGTFENLTGSAHGDTLTARLGSTFSVIEGIVGDDSIFVDDGFGGDTADGGLGTDACTADASDTRLGC